MFERLFGGIVLVILNPLFLVLVFLNLIFCGRPIFFTQKRVGKNKQVFLLYKFRTMVVWGEKNKKKYRHLNEADGPVFKIRHDPRFTSFGKFLSHTALDELPQLINIVKGDMRFIGPRPLPVYESKNVPKKYENRFSVLPGITSLWVVRGGHTLSFHEWMELDLFYVAHRSVFLDMRICFQTIALILSMFIKYLQKDRGEKLFN